ncbi:hypothetical protein SJAV_11050 [Sulfurisphaera javensis]|uniref:Uncharacterized protein n=1 Tax=Sulfurisphaera javensis TaxID=2049879 RepID=A0AAT9GR99_9CREN
MTEDIIKQIISNQELIDAITKKVYEKLKDDVVIQRLEKLEQQMVEILKVIQNTNDNLVLIWEKMDYHDTVLGKHSNILDEHTKLLQEQTRILNEQTKVLEDHTKILLEQTKLLQEQTRIVLEHTELLKEHSKKLDNITDELRKIRISLDSFTSRAGHYVEKTIMELYKEALKIHGIDPSNVKHGYVEDVVGIVSKGRKYEIDFYETDDIIHLFEVKNLCDEDAIEQIEIRIKLLSSQQTRTLNHT